MKNILKIALFSFSVSSAFAGGAAIEFPKQDWSWNGPFNAFNNAETRAAAQRGFQVYKEVCSACHGLDFLPYRALEEIGFSKAEIKAIAAEATIIDGPNDEGEMFERPGKASDIFVNPYANPQEAAAVNNGAAPPDLTLMTKARNGGADYLYALLIGYVDAPADFQVQEGLYYNKYFKGHQIAMAPPLLSEGQVTYEDGTEATIDQMSRDVVTFLAWTAEPEMTKRKKLGLRVVGFLFLLTIMFYLSYKKLWRDIK